MDWSTRETAIEKGSLPMERVRLQRRQANAALGLLR